MVSRVSSLADRVGTDRDLSLRALGFVLAMAVLSGCGGLSVTRPASGEWQQAGGGVERSRVAAALSAPLAEAWQDNAQAAFGAESVVGGGGVVYVGTRQGEVLGYEVETGKRIGYLEVGDSVEGPLAVDGTTLYVASTGTRGDVQAHDLRRGERLWHRKMEPVESGILLADGRVVVVEADGTVQALDARTGQTIWAHEPARSALVKAASVRAGEAVVVADVTGLVRALRLDDGSVAWTLQLEAPVFSTPAASGGLLYAATTQGHLVAIDVRTGERRAQAMVGALVTTADRPVGIRLTAPAVANGLVVVGGSDAVLRAFDASTLAPAWSHTFEDGISAAPVFAGSLLYVATLGGEVAAFGTTGGAPVWTGEVRSRVKSALAVIDGRLIVLTEPRHIVAFAPTSQPTQP